MSPSTDQNQREKAARLIEYLLRLTSLRSKLIRDITKYEEVLWLNDIPRQKECFTQAWGRDEDYDSDVWIEIKNRREPKLPTIPDECKDWIDKSSIRNKNDLPELLPNITRQVENPDWLEGTDQPEYISQTENLINFPEVQAAWNRYIENLWLSWAEDHSLWETIHKVYSKLFVIHQEQLRLGEEYELILGIGLLTWQTPTEQYVRRHMIVADAVLEFEARLEKFTVRPHTEGIKLRPELDMLDIGEQPVRAEETAKSALANAGDDPWDKGCVEGVLQALVHSIDSQGEYEESLESKIKIGSEKPVIEYAPALILRKRSTKGLKETLKKIKERIEDGENIPGEFADLAEIRTHRDNDSIEDPEQTNGAFDGEVFFPKPWNEEQRRILLKIRAASGVLVQGPPGTGKSHTIANLICHLLAIGQRILITAKTPRALKVLEKLVPDELRPLCINLLGRGLEEKRSLESSVGGILRKNEEWDEKKSERERKELEQNLSVLREDKIKTSRQLRDIRESETHSQSIAEGNYRGTAARIVEAINIDKSKYEWFTDNIAWDQQCTIAESDLLTILADLRLLTSEKQNELNLERPKAIPSPEYFANLVEREKRVIEEEVNLTRGADEHLFALLSKNKIASIETIRDTFSNFDSAVRKVSSFPYAWIPEALRDTISSTSSLWREILSVTKDIIASIETLVPIADENTLDIPVDSNIKTLFKDACILKKHMKNGGKLGWGPFRPKLVKELNYIIKGIRLNGRSCSTIENFTLLSNILQVYVESDKVWGFWTDRCKRPQGPYHLQMQTLKAICEALDFTLSIEALINKCRQALQQSPAIGEPNWADESQISRIFCSCTLALANKEKHLVEKEIHNIESPLAILTSKSDIHPMVAELREAIKIRDIEKFAHTWNYIQELEKEHQRILKLNERISKLHRSVPKLTDELKLTCEELCWDERLRQIINAWHWAQAKNWIEDYIRKEDVPALVKRVKQIEEEINTIIAKLASLHAWSFCFYRLKENHRRHMEAWQQSMRRLGKGTGKHAPRHRREAQQHLNQCREAVPAWVMPLHRVWDTVEPAPGMFDVIIVDEASQCGVEALPLLYLAKKILIVGDDKQISPDAVGLPRDAVHRLMEEYLYDFRFKSSFDVESSLFDHGKLRYATSRITLREHFRCMPEIIRFSNDLCYSDTPLIPLRQYGQNRLIPLEHIFLSGGYREGSTTRIINRLEADAIVEKIIEYCNDNQYNGKTIGVVVLQGEAQAKLIDGQLLERLGAEEMELRNIVCGNPYSFQGDERDIMLLSLVAATNERIGPLTKASDERRFNVAASRARDKMILFHSVTCDDLSTSCLRRQLLEFFENRKPQEIAGINQEELERRAFHDNRGVVKPPSPFDSWFEVDVALELLRKDFIVIPQHEVAGKKIDLVIVGGQGRLAVECDGDYWHGLDNYEADMQRQRQLERCGWEFFRVRESAFYLNKEQALKELWRALEERDIFPAGCSKELSLPDNEENILEADNFCNEESDGEFEDVLPLPEDLENNGMLTNSRLDKVSSSEISKAIIHALEKCPNCSCTMHSLTSRVLKELGIITRGNPRLDFEKRVMRCLNTLENRDLIEKYKSKNKRVRLLDSLPE